MYTNVVAICDLKKMYVTIETKSCLFFVVACFENLNVNLKIFFTNNVAN